jgi:hypothetical protein
MSGSHILFHEGVEVVAMAAPLAGVIMWLTYLLCRNLLEDVTDPTHEWGLPPAFCPVYLSIYWVAVGIACSPRGWFIWWIFVVPLSFALGAPLLVVLYFGLLSFLYGCIPYICGTITLGVVCNKYSWLSGAWFGPILELAAGHCGIKISAVTARSVTGVLTGAALAIGIDMFMVAYDIELDDVDPAAGVSVV